MPDWNKLASGLVRAVEGAGEYMQEGRARMEDNFAQQLRSKSDQSIKNGLRNIDSSDWRYKLIEREASKRGIY